jgi:hypothetical protein
MSALQNPAKRVRLGMIQTWRDMPSEELVVPQAQEETFHREVAAQ